MPHARPDQPGNLHAPLLHHVNPVPGVTFLGNLLVRQKLPFPGRCLQRFQFFRLQPPEKRRCFERNHAPSLNEISTS